MPLAQFTVRSSSLTSSCFRCLAYSIGQFLADKNSDISSMYQLSDHIRTRDWLCGKPRLQVAATASTFRNIVTHPPLYFGGTPTASASKSLSSSPGHGRRKPEDLPWQLSLRCFRLQYVPKMPPDSHICRSWTVTINTGLQRPNCPRSRNTLNATVASATKRLAICFTFSCFQPHQYPRLDADVDFLRATVGYTQGHRSSSRAKSMI